MDQLQEHMRIWTECEGRKAHLRTQISTLTKEQRTSTKALRAHMEENGLDSLECGNGWVYCREDKETNKFSFTEDDMLLYTGPDELDRIKGEKRKRRRVYHGSQTIHPSDSPCIEEEKVQGA